MAEEKSVERPLPQSTVQAAGRVAEDVVSGLKAQPMLLGLIVLNVIGIGATLWFLHELIEISNVRYTQLMKYCFGNYTTPSSILEVN